jgi:hypothetical protein
LAFIGWVDQSGFAAFCQPEFARSAVTTFLLIGGFGPVSVELVQALDPNSGLVIHTDAFMQAMRGEIFPVPNRQVDVVCNT